MIFNSYSRLRDKHSFLSASNWHWINDDEEDLIKRLERNRAAALGTRLHKVAEDLIDLKIKLPNNKKTINQYVNDCIDFNMKTEVILYYSDNAFCTADAISFDGNTLRVFDLKTGVKKASPNQLIVYAAYFCLEYDVFPNDISFDLRIYQSTKITKLVNVEKDILYVMEKIKISDIIISNKLIEMEE